MVVLTKEKAEGVKAGFSWRCGLCGQRGNTSAGYLRHKQSFILHDIFMSFTP